MELCLIFGIDPGHDDHLGIDPGWNGTLRTDYPEPTYVDGIWLRPELQLK